MVEFDPKPTPAGPKVLVLVGDWVEDYEAMVPIEALEMLSIVVDVASPGKNRGQLVLSCIHAVDRTNIDGARVGRCPSPTSCPRDDGTPPRALATT